MSVKQPSANRLRFLLWDMEFRWKRLRVCLLCWRYLNHWPMNDLSEGEWRWQLEDQTARGAFLEGWCRD